MLNWNWSQAFPQSMLTLTIISILAGHSAQAQTGSTPTTPMKVGETRSQSLSRGRNDVIARIHAHKLDGRNAATVYVRGIPVVTYVESDDSNSPSGNTQDSAQSARNSATSTTASKSTKNKNTSKPVGEVKSASESLVSQDNPEALLVSPNPIERATAVAALINQFNRDGIDPSKIVPIWRNGKYLIKIGDRTMLKFDDQALFPESMKNQTEDVLESANLLRRLLGGAAPISEVIDAPKKKPVAISPAFTDRIVAVMSGMASWYGPGFDGNYSASGEIFRASEMTAAHPDLPFGTLVRVVNLDNGQSVVVRINDRGPYAHGRVIDISAAAANVIGLIASGIAPVRLEVLSQ